MSHLEVISKEEYFSEEEIEQGEEEYSKELENEELQQHILFQIVEKPIEKPNKLFNNRVNSIRKLQFF